MGSMLSALQMLDCLLDATAGCGFSLTCCKGGPALGASSASSLPARTRGPLPFPWGSSLPSPYQDDGQKVPGTCVFLPLESPSQPRTAGSDFWTAEGRRRGFSAAA